MADKVRGDRVRQLRIQVQASKTANTQAVQAEMNMRIFPGPGNYGKAARVSAEGEQQALPTVTMRAGAPTLSSPGVQLETTAELGCMQLAAP